MDLPEVQQQLARYQYKPGWAFRVEARTLILTARLPDARTGRHDQMVKIGSAVSIPVYLDQSEDQFAAWLRWVVHERERHEADEWLRRDGVVLFDPHAGGYR